MDTNKTLEILLNLVIGKFYLNIPQKVYVKSKVQDLNN